VSVPQVSAHVRFDGHRMALDVDRGVYGPSSVRALLDAENLHPLTAYSTDAGLFELLDFCIAYYALDRSTLRPRGGWAREMVVRFPVRRLDLWRQHSALLREWLLALTGDIVEVVPVVRAESGSHHDRDPVLSLDEHVEIVALLSDGLDSLCGVDSVARSSQHFALASVITAGSRYKRIEQIVGLARGLGDREIQHHIVRTNLHQEHKIKEKTQRSRTVLAIVTGLTVAAALNASFVESYENGFGLLNLPIPDLQYGAMSSQVLQPAHLLLWDRVSRAFFGRTIALRYPNRFRTKAEMINPLSLAAQRLVPITSSCDSEYRKKGVGVLQCGLCGSCRFRQLAIARSGIDIFGDVYADQQMNKEPDAIARLYYHASLLARALDSADSWTALTKLQPELRHVPYSDDGRLQLSELEMNIHRNDLREQTMALLRRHIQELRAWEGLTHAA
jgi:hypothetical protein